MGKTLTLSLGSAKRDLCTVLNIIVTVSVPLRGTVVVGWLSVPSAALLRSLQWVSDGRSRFAEPRCLQALAASLPHNTADKAKNKTAVCTSYNVHLKNVLN